MKNNKGIILSVYIYILLVFFLLILSTMLMVLNNTKMLSTKMKNSLGDMIKVNEDFSIVLIGSSDVIHAKGTTYTDLGYYAQTTEGTTITATVTTNININVNGNYTYTYTAAVNGKTKSVTRNVSVITKTTDFSYTGGSQTYVTPADGYYLIELWGAQGGNSQSKGAYVSGYTYFEKNQQLYVFVGQGLNTTGDGTSFNAGTGSSGGYPGGGATDIRLIDGAWNNSVSINSRIMVAAGSGSGPGNSNTVLGAGGDLVGKSGVGTVGGTQLTYGASNYVVSAFGIANGGCAGGNGYYPGGGASCADGAGGGSSFISGYAGVNAIANSSSTLPIYNTIHYSGKYFIGGKMSAGVNAGNGKAKITYVSTTKPMKINSNLNNVRYIKDCINGSTGNTGNHWVELQAIKNGTNVAISKTVAGTSFITSSNYITDGDITSSNYAYGASDSLQCITVDLEKSYDLDEIAVWHYWADGRTYYSNTTYTSLDNSNWTTVISNASGETSQGKRINAYEKNYNYTGGAQTFTAPISGYYNIEAWGASGGNGSTTYIGGKGGYTSGKIYLETGTTLNLYVGGVGPAVGSSTNTTGGYNGGGNCYSYAANYVTGCGGGASDVRLTSGAWNDATSLASRIMVAGAGGGGHYRSDTSSYGGAGGGLSGNTSYSETSSYAKVYPTGGTQMAGGAKGYVDDGSRITSITNSGFGYGGSINTSALTWNLLGGGSGYWGGGAGVFMASSGGSSYISGHTGAVAIISASSTSPRTGTSGAACSQGGTDNLCSIHYSGKYFTNTIMIDGAGYTWTNIKGSLVQMPSPTGGYYDSGFGNVGNGAIRITYIGS